MQFRGRGSSAEIPPLATQPYLATVNDGTYTVVFMFCLQVIAVALAIVWL